MPDNTLEALLAQADAEVERLTALKDKRFRLQNVNAYIPQVNARIKALEPLVEPGVENLMLLKMQTALKILNQDKEALEKEINPDRQTVAVVTKEVRLGAPDPAPRPSEPLVVEPPADAVSEAVEDAALRQERREKKRTLSGMMASEIHKLRRPDMHAIVVPELRDLIESYICVADPEEISELADRIAHCAFVVASGPQFRDLRRVMRSKGIKVEEKIEQPVEVPVTLEEKYRGSFAGKSCVILGGIAFPEAVDRITDFFGFETLAWVTGDKAAALKACCNRIAAGKVDVVFSLVKLCSHIAEDHVRKACRSNGTLYAMVRGGYSTNNLIRSLEESSIKVTV